MLFWGYSAVYNSLCGRFLQCEVLMRNIKAGLLLSKYFTSCFIILVPFSWNEMMSKTHTDTHTHKHSHTAWNSGMCYVIIVKKN